jgi:tellurite resistance-related uncharacterized protein
VGVPYRSTSVFTEATLPLGLRRDHSTKAGTWGVIRVLEGRLLFEAGGRIRVLTPEQPATIAPQEKHRVEPLGAMRMQVDFYTCDPATG